MIIPKLCLKEITTLGVASSMLQNLSGHFIAKNYIIRVPEDVSINEAMSVCEKRSKKRSYTSTDPQYVLLNESIIDATKKGNPILPVTGGAINVHQLCSVLRIMSDKETRTKAPALFNALWEKGSNLVHEVIILFAYLQRSGLTERTKNKLGALWCVSERKSPHRPLFEAIAWWVSENLTNTNALVEQMHQRYVKCVCS
jgi:hypothetical protein